MNQREQHPGTISGQFKQKFFELLANSTFHGLPNIFLSKNILGKIFWLLATLVSYCFCAFLVTNTILDYEKHEVVTRYDRVYEHQPDFPAFYLFGHDQNETECTFNNEPCLDDPTEPFEAFHSGSEMKKSKDYGSGSGLKLKLRVTNISTGIEVIIMNQSTIHRIDPHYISAGMRTTFAIKRIFESRLPAPYSDCRINVTGSEKIDELELPYDQTECLYYCELYLVAENCNLLDEFLEFSYLFYDFSDVNSFSLFDNNLSSIYDKCDPSLIYETEDNYDKIGPYEACKNFCPVECNSFKFSISEFSFKLPDFYPENYAELNIFYETFEYTIISQTPKITLDVVLGTIGGLLGLFLGASLLTFGEIFELSLNIVKIVVFSKKAKVVNNYNNNFLQIVHLSTEAKNLKELKRRTFYKISPSMVTKVQRHGFLSSLKKEHKK